VDRSNSTNVKDWLVGQIPLRYHVPLRYWYRFATRRLEREWSVIKRLLAKGRVSIDIGANNGVYTYALSRVSARVEAFEPLPACARTLEAFGAANVEVHEVALSSTSGARELFIPVESGIAHTALASFVKPKGIFQTISVPLRTLDSYGFHNVCFIKIDVEGHELEVLRGAAMTIAECKPMVLVEVEQRHLNFPMDLVFNEFSSFGYEGFFTANGKLLPLEAFSYEVHQAPFAHDVLSRHYVNNFIFVHDGSREHELFR
jgi:FkbM family methyltransferase